MTRLELTITATTGRQFIGFLNAHLLNAHRIAGSSLRELSVALVGWKRMSELHERFMGIAGPTDVLSFALEADARNRPISGEIIICVPIARARTRRSGVPLKHELLLYALHGMLHLSRWDDKTERQYRRMHKMEDELLRRLGVGPVFSKGRQ